MPLSEFQLYDGNTIDQLVWPQTDDGQYAEQFLKPLIKKGIRHFIDNVDAEMLVLKADNKVLPVAVVTENYTNSWVCSPYAHYISYGSESVNLIGNSFVTCILKGCLRLIEKVSKFGKMNSVVYINNWLFSTDLYPEGFSTEQLKKIVDLIKKRYPQHAIVFRSLNSLTLSHWMESLQAQKFKLMASRYVFVTDGNDSNIFKTRIVKSDLKLLRETSYKIVEEESFSVEESKKILDLYRLLYVEQHSHLQPQFNYHYMQLLVERKLLRFKVLKDSADNIKGVAGYYKRNGVMMCPILGYDKNESESNTIYRLLNVVLLNECHKDGVSFNQSAGASFFKSLRRAEGSLEYMAIYFNHLSFGRKFFWSTLKFFINMVGPAYMKKY